MLAHESAANMCFRRRSSASGNNTAEQARAALINAFEVPDMYFNAFHSIFVHCLP